MSDTPEKRKRGRPPSLDPRTEVITVKCTPGEKKELVGGFTLVKDEETDAPFDGLATMLRKLGQREVRKARRTLGEKT